MRPRAGQHPDRDHGQHTLRIWRGTVVGVQGDDVFVELGPRMQGVISVRQFDAPPEEGDSFEFTLRGKEDSLWALSLAASRSLASWEEMEAGSLVAARVVQSVPGGLQLKIGPLHAFMPRSQTGLARDKKPAVLVGKTLTCEVIEVDPERQRVVVSRKLVLQHERESRARRQAGLLTPGQVVHGRVSRVEDYGAFVTFGRGLEGLIHVSNLSFERVDHPSEVVKVGDSIEAKVIYVKNSGKKIGLGLKQMQESPWRAVEREHWEGEIVLGRVTRLADFGAFVAIRRGVEGLVHESESGLTGRRLREVLQPGQELSVRIVHIEVEDERLTLSLVHPGGARIAPEEAEGARRFAERSPEREDELATNLGELLRRALGPRAGDGGEAAEAG